MRLVQDVFIDALSQCRGNDHIQFDYVFTLDEVKENLMKIVDPSTISSVETRKSVV